MITRPSTALAILVFAVFSGSSLWFSCNAILNELTAAMPSSTFDVSSITTAVQLGFISGTLVFAMLNLADRFPTGRVFLISSILGSASNALILILPLDIDTLLASRYLTGFFLAGIYPVGVKIAALWQPNNLGRALGHIVGALVVGTAFPHLINGLGISLNWQLIILSSSTLAIIGGLLVGLALVEKSKPQHSTQHQGKALFNIFKSPNFKSSSYGYFGHMWELYTFWAFLPLILLTYNQYAGVELNISLWSFLIIASGAIGCSVGGLLSFKLGSANIAFYQLTTSALCCLVFPLMLTASPNLFLAYLFIWGITVAGDSPQFSTLNAKTAPTEVLASAITLVICLGFSLTIISMYTFKFIMLSVGLPIAVSLMAVGPICGLMFLYPLKNKQLPL